MKNGLLEHTYDALTLAIDRRKPEIILEEKGMACNIAQRASLFMGVRLHSSRASQKQAR